MHGVFALPSPPRGTGRRIFRRGLWFYVGILNIPLFYLNQFSALGVAVLQFLILWSLIEFRIRHLDETPELKPIPEMSGRLA